MRDSNKCDIPNIGRTIYVICVLWYAFLGSSSIVLRPYASLMWALFAVVGIAFNISSLRYITRYDFLAICSCLIVCISVILSQAINSSYTAFVKMLLYFFVAAGLSYDEEMRKKSFQIGFVFLVLHMLIGYVQMLIPELYKTVFVPLISAHSMDAVSNRIRRVIFLGLTTQNGVSGFWMTMGLGFAQSRLYVSNKKAKSIVMCGLFYIAVLLSQKRLFAIAALFVLLLVYYLVSHKQGKMVRMLLILLAIMLSVMSFSAYVPQLTSIIEKTRLLTESDNLLNGRTSIYESALEIFKQYPLFGIGYAAFKSVSGIGMDVHNSYLQSLVEFGLFGVLIFWLPYLYCFVCTIKEMKMLKSLEYGECYEKELLIASFFVQTVILIWGMTGNPMVDDTVLFIFIWMQKSAMNSLRSRQGESST